MQKGTCDAQPSTKSISNTKTERLLADHLVQWLFANQIRLKSATEAKYTNIIESHTVPAIGGVKLSALSSSTINAFLDRQPNQGGIKNGKALAPSYVRTITIIIEASINYGIMERQCTPLRTPINKSSISKKDLVVLSRVAETTLTEILMRDSSKTAIGTLAALQASLRFEDLYIKMVRCQL